jgi:hypothetical protein
MSKEQEAIRLRAKAAKYRALGRLSNDDTTAHEILSLAAQLEQQARDLKNGK